MNEPESTRPARVPTSVYRYYDVEGVLLYVGITSRGSQRNAEHNADKRWWRYVVRQDVEHFPSRAAAAAEEKRLILKYRPPFNKQHNIGAAEFQRIYETYAVGKRVSNSDIIDTFRRAVPFNLVAVAGKQVIIASRAEHAIFIQRVSRELPYPVAAQTAEGAHLGSVKSMEFLGRRATTLVIGLKKEPPQIRSVSVMFKQIQPSEGLYRPSVVTFNDVAD